jgi:hypothetical protein
MTFRHQSVMDWNFLIQLAFALVSTFFYMPNRFDLDISHFRFGVPIGFVLDMHSILVLTYPGGLVSTYPYRAGLVWLNVIIINNMD